MNNQQGIYPNYSYSGFSMPNFQQRQFMQNPQAQMFMQPQMQTQQSMAQFQAPIQAIQFATAEEAKAFIVMPNTSALLIDKNSGIAHLKSADNLGQSVTSYYKFTEVTAEGKPLKKKEEPSEPKEIDLAKFASKDELKGFVTLKQYSDLESNYKFLADQLRIMQKQINGGKLPVQQQAEVQDK